MIESVEIQDKFICTPFCTKEIISFLYKHEFFYKIRDEALKIFDHVTDIDKVTITIYHKLYFDDEGKTFIWRVFIREPELKHYNDFWERFKMPETLHSKEAIFSPTL